MYITITKKNQPRLLLVFGTFLSIILSSAFNASAQVSAYSFSQSVGTYSAITGGTSLSSGAAMDDANFTSQPIGFTFNYNGINFTTFSVNENGYIRFATSVGNSYSVISATAANTMNTVAAANDDLGGLSASSNLRFETIGTAPNRTLVVQWTAISHYGGTSNMNFQIRLNETVNTIQFMYGAFAPTTTDAFQIGIKGATNTDFNNRTTTSNWSATTAGTANFNTVTYSATVFPASGLTFTFTPPPPCSGTPSGGVATLNTIPGCGTGNFTLGVTVPTVTGITFQWQSSPDNITWTNVASAINATYSAAPVSTATFFRRNTNCTASGLSGSSSALLVKPVYGGTALATAPACGDSLTLSLTGQSPSITGVQWESSTDSIAWSPIAGAISATQKVVSPTSIMFYRAIVTCSASSSTDNSIPVRVRPVRAGTTVINSTFCNDSTTLSLSGASTGSLTYAWFSSIDSITWTAMSLTSATPRFPSPTALRFYRSIVTCGASSDTSVAVRVVEPCQGFGPYSITRNAASTFTSIQGTGTNFTWAVGSADDDRSSPVVLPFSFNYSGATRNAFYVCSNGWLSFDTTVLSNAWGNDLNTTSPRLVLAPFWDDLFVLAGDLANRNRIKYLVTGTAPNRVLTVEWGEMELNGYGSPNLNFQVKLYEGSNNIEYVYGRMQPFDGTGSGSFSHSIGMTGASPSNGQRMALLLENTRNFSASTINNNLSIAPACNSSYLFTAGAAFNPSTTSGIPTNDSLSTPITITVNTAPCADACGTYYSSRNATASAVATGPAVGGGNPDDDVWFQFNAPLSGQINISVIGSSGYNPAFQLMTTSFDTTGIGPAGSRNANTNDIEQATAVGLSPSTAYLLRVFSAGAGSGSNSGAFALCINEVVPIPINDDTSGAIALTATANFVGTTGTSLGATPSTQTVCGGTADDDVWYRFIPNNFLDTISVTGSSLYRAHVQVLTAGLVSLACQNTNTNAGQVKFAVGNLKRDSAYYIRIYHTNSGASTGGFTVGVYGRPGVNNDLSGITVTRPTQQNCFPANDSVFATIRNASFTNVPFDFSTNNATARVRITPPTGPSVTLISPILTGGTLAPNTDTTVFVGTYTFTVGGAYNFRAIAKSTIDTNVVNDTGSSVIRTNNLFTAPWVNRIDSAAETAQLTFTTFGLSATNGTGGSQCLRVNLYSFQPTASIRTPRFSITPASVMAFRYKITNWSGGGATTLNTNDSILLEVSTDCGATFTRTGFINGSNHTPSTDFATGLINISPFAANEIIVRIRADWNGTSNDAYLDIDSMYIFNTVPPTVTTGTKTNVSNLTATLAGNILSTGGGIVTASGVVIGTTAAPVIGGLGVINAATSPTALNGAFTANATGLTASTTYTYRAYAITGAGTSYGADSTFTTLAAPTAPVISRLPADSITTTTARAGGNIISNGGSAMVASGIVYATTPNPVIGGIGATDVTTSPLVSSGSYMVAIAGLTQGTKYYFRAYATNGIGTGYSTQDSFTTSPIISTLPYLQTFDVVGNTGWSSSAVVGTANDWVVGTPAKTNLSGAFSGTNAYVTKLTGNYTASQNSAIVSPQFDFTGLTNDPILRFRSNFDFESDYDLGIVEISINGGAWVKLDNTLGTGSNFNTINSASWYNNNAGSLTVAGPAFSGASNVYSTANAGGWVKSATRLTGAAGQANVRFRLRFACDGAVEQQGWAVDNIEVVNITTPTIAATSVTVPTLTNTTAALSWVNGNGEGRLIVARLSSTASVAPLDNRNYNAASFGIGDSTGLGNFVVFKGTGTSTTIGGLSLLTTYSFDVYEYNGEVMHVRFAPAASNTATTTPVTLTSLNATTKGADALVQWTTSSEINNKGFEVQRSIDGKTFESVGSFVAGKGNSSVIVNYSFIDEKAFTVANSNLLYYRLKQFDFDGKTELTRSVKVLKNADKLNAVSVFPNPYTENYSVTFNAQEDGSALIEMVDIQGKVVRTYNKPVTSGGNTLTIDNTETLEGGIYFARLTVNGETHVIKVVKH